jgi:hypothetical protein
MTLADACCLVGYALLSAGLWLLSPPLALVVAGTLLFIAGGLSASRQGGRR